MEANWTQGFAGVPDMTAEVRAAATDGSMSWSEWVWRGTHLDGAPYEMRGVIVMGLTDGGAVELARLYMKPVERDGAGIEETVRQLSRPPS